MRNRWQSRFANVNLGLIGNHNPPSSQTKIFAWSLFFGGMLGTTVHARAHARARARQLATAVWPCNTWGESDRADGWRGANWSGNARWTNQRLHEPESLAELCEVVVAARRVRVIGSAHSFPPIVSGVGCATHIHACTYRYRIVLHQLQACT